MAGAVWQEVAVRAVEKASVSEVRKERERRG